MRAARSGKPDSLKMLIAAGADVNVVNKQGLTPLLVAAQSGTPEKVRMLLDAKANRDAKGPLGKNALEIAKARSDDNGKAIAAMLEAK
jgi:ankyrin repeat protein